MDQIYDWLLQWGRNLTVAEGCAVGEILGLRADASMGPQLDSCGRGPWEETARTPGALQWGRNLTVAEGWNGHSGSVCHH